MSYFFYKKTVTLLILSFLLSITTMAQQNYKNESLTIGIRVKDLLAKLTLKEKASLLGYRSEAVPRRISPLITGGMKDYMV
ncbi:hypothetical protein [Pedobacter sp. JCM 36344]|uniref:hypothetical protein n=1 Tax=Pedobacter sp. JCM 36344 TaxID=3374280 RepID=UPI00397D9558